MVMCISLFFCEEQYFGVFVFEIFSLPTKLEMNKLIYLLVARLAFVLSLIPVTTS